MSSTTRSKQHLRLLRQSGEEESLAQPSPSPEPPLVSPSAGSSQRVPSRAPGTSQADISGLADAQLVALVRAGDRRAFEALYRRHVVFAIHLATRIEGSSRDVEDVVHDAFIKAWSRIGDLAEPAAFKSWLGSIVVFAVRSRLRRARLMNLLGLGRVHDPVDLDSLASPSASPHVRAELAQIYALLRTRPADERIAWTLRSVEGQELETVARLTGWSLATVKRRIAKVQAFLEEHFVASDSAASGSTSDPPTSAKKPLSPQEHPHRPGRSS